MKWIILWFTFTGTPITGLPEKTFDTRAECEKFGNSRVGLVQLMNKDRVLFECHRSVPYGGAT